MIAIIGAGLSGLTAAKILNDRGIKFVLYEKNDKVGGRVKSDHINGYTLDHGFQVLLNSYPQVKKYINQNDLHVGGFAPGAKIYKSPGNSFIVGDPLRKPKTLFSTITAPIGSLIDKLKIIQLKFTNTSKEQSTNEFLKNFGFSEKIIKSFFKPFFSGVFLETELRTDSKYFLFLYQKFSEGFATLPEKGMQSVPNQLAKDFQDKIKLNSTIQNILEKDDKFELEFQNGDKKIYDQVVMAVEAPTLKKFFPEIKIPENKRAVTTIYFESSEQYKDSDFLLLNGSGTGRVNHIAFLSAVQKSYAPKGKQLISVNLLDLNVVNPDEVIKEIESWKLFSTKDWKHIKTYKVEYAQPDTFWSGKNNIELKKNLFIAGDYTQTPSIEGAMRSGEFIAEKIF